MEEILNMLPGIGLIVASLLLLTNCFLHVIHLFGREDVEFTDFLFLVVLIFHPLIYVCRILFSDECGDSDNKGFFLWLEKMITVIIRLLIFSLCYFLPVFVLFSELLSRSLCRLNHFYLNRYLDNYYVRLAKRAGLKDWKLLKKFVNDYWLGKQLNREIFKEVSRLRIVIRQEISGKVTIGYTTEQNLMLEFTNKRGSSIFDICQISKKAFNKLTETVESFFLMEVLSWLVFLYVLCFALESFKDKIDNNKNELEEILKIWRDNNHNSLSISDYLNTPDMINLLREFYRLHRMAFEEAELRDKSENIKIKISNPNQNLEILEAELEKRFKLLIEMLKVGYELTNNKNIGESRFQLSRKEELKLVARKLYIVRKLKESMKRNCA